MTDACLFCGIVAGTVNADMVLEDEHVVGFLDVRPLFKGHVLLVPRQHLVTLADLPEDLMVPLFAGMLERDRKREGLRVCQVAWLLGVSVREYRELEAGTSFPTFDTWDRMCKLYGWSQRFLGGPVHRSA